MPTFKTIRQTAALGMLTENRLRIMLREGRLPGFYTGTRYMVNTDLLAEQLEAMSRASCEAEA